MLELVLVITPPTKVCWVQSYDRVWLYEPSAKSINLDGLVGYEVV
jgi:hypothetical protein